MWDVHLQLSSQSFLRTTANPGTGNERLFHVLNVKQEEIELKSPIYHRRPSCWVHDILLRPVGCLRQGLEK